MDKELDGLDPGRMTELWILAKRAGFAGSGVKNYAAKLRSMGVKILPTGKSLDYHLVRNRDIWNLFDGET